MGDRRTFVVHVYGDGPATVQDVRTGKRTALVGLAEVAEQISLWLAGDVSVVESDFLAGDDAGLEA